MTNNRPESDESELDDDESPELDLASTVAVGFGADFRWARNSSLHSTTTYIHVYVIDIYPE